MSDEDVYVPPSEEIDHLIRLKKVQIRELRALLRVAKMRELSGARIEQRSRQDVERTGGSK